MNYTPRSQMMPYHTRRQRWACIVAHRRFGKTVATIADLITAAISCSKPDPQFGYVAPFREQAKAIAWRYLKKYGESVIRNVNESELWVELVNGARIRLYGADNENALRGLYLDGCVLDEYGDMRPSVWGEIIRPLLADRKGWATFIGTPKGQNHFYEIFKTADNNPDWLRLSLKASETGVISADELADSARTMTPEQYAQEFECDFNTPAIGAVYRQEMTAAEPRITSVAYDPMLPVHTFFDLGMGDFTAIWFAQFVRNEVRLIDYYENNGQAITHYVATMQQRGYVYGQDWLPHDARAREMGTGKSIEEVMRNLGRDVRITPNIGLENGINAARLLFGRCWFDKDKTARGIECLQNYRREYDAKRGGFKPTPLHDWSSHGADAFRYLAVAHQEITEPTRHEHYADSGGWMG